MTHPTAITYIEKRPPIPTPTQLELAAIDSHFFDDLMDRSIILALDPSQSQPIRDPHHFKTQADLARANLYESFEKETHQCTELLRLRSDLLSKLEAIQPPPKANKILNSNLDFSFAPDSYALRTFTTATPATFAPFKSDSSASATIPKPTNENVMRSNLFSTDSNRLLQTDNINQAHRLIEFAMLIEEFRINRFTPEINTPHKISVQRLEEVWQSLQSD